MRFGPWSATRCQETALEQFADDVAAGRRGRYGISVFGDVVGEGESVEDVLKRICVEAPCRGKKVAAVWAQDLQNAGWVVSPEMPPRLHYLLGQGDFSQIPDVDSLAVIWMEHKRDNPANG